MKQLSVRIPDRDYAMIQEMAERSNIDFSEALRETIRHGLDKHELVERLDRIEQQMKTLKSIRSICAGLKRFIELFYAKVQPNIYREIKSKMKDVAIEMKESRYGDK